MPLNEKLTDGGLRSFAGAANGSATDTEMLDWLAERCWYPNDHPSDAIAVLIPEQFSKHGSFTCNPENDKKALRAAIQRAMSPNDELCVRISDWFSITQI